MITKTRVLLSPGMAEAFSCLCLRESLLLYKPSQSHSHLPPLPLPQKTSENHVSLVGLPSNESLFSRPECL